MTKAVEVITSVQRRRRWSRAEKERIVAAAMAPGAVASEVARAAGIYAERFADPDGRIRATFSFVWMSGWAPDSSQQKPLEPGSAQVSLAHVLAKRG